MGTGMGNGKDELELPKLQACPPSTKPEHAPASQHRVKGEMSLKTQRAGDAQHLRTHVRSAGYSGAIQRPLTCKHPPFF